MKIVFPLLIIFLLSINCFSQDTITKRNGERIIAKIIEISLDEVKYKKFDYQDGPTYVSSKSDIDMIQFSTGIKEYFGNREQPSTSYYNNKPAVIINGRPFINNDKIVPFGHTRWSFENKLYFEKPLVEILFQTNDAEIKKLITKAKHKKKQQYWGFAIFPLAGAAIAFGSGSTDTRFNGSVQNIFVSSSAVFAAAGIGAFVFDIVVSQQRRSYVNKAIGIYNQKY